MFIEQLQSRVMFSVVSVAAATAKRDVAGIGQPVTILQRECSAAIQQIVKELLVFHAKTDGALVTSLKSAYQAQLKVLKSDVAAAKILYARGINRVASDAAVAQRRPGDAGALDQLMYEEGLLTAQAATASSTLANDGDSLQRDCAVDLSAIDNAHAIDATLASDTSQFSSAVITETGVLNGLTGTIQNDDVPALIAAA